MIIRIFDWEIIGEMVVTAKFWCSYLSNSPRMGASIIWSLTQNFSCIFYIYLNSNPSYWKLVQKEDNCTIGQSLRIFNFKDIIRNVSNYWVKLLFCPVILRNIRCSKQQISYKYWENDFTLPHIWDYHTWIIILPIHEMNELFDQLRINVNIKKITGVMISGIATGHVVHHPHSL